MKTKRLAPAPKRTIPGRPPTGPDGSRVSDYPRLTVRIPRTTKNQLELMSTLQRVPVWKLIDRAVLAYIEQLPEAQRRRIEQVSKQMLG